MLFQRVPLPGMGGLYREGVLCSTMKINGGEYRAARGSWFPTLRAMRLREGWGTPGVVAVRDL
jgi:hypothetical protein